LVAVHELYGLRSKVTTSRPKSRGALISGTRPSTRKVRARFSEIDQNIELFHVFAIEAMRGAILFTNVSSVCVCVQPEKGRNLVLGGTNGEVRH
jgi:hypothetical protein